MTAADWSGGATTDGGRAALDGDVCAHAVEFAYVHKAVFEDVFSDRCCSFCLGGEGHELGLHVGGKAGVLFGRDICGFELAAFRTVGADADVVLADVEADSGLLQLGDDGAEMGWVAAVDVEVSAGDCACDEEGSGFDAVGV